MSANSLSVLSLHQTDTCPRFTLPSHSMVAGTGSRPPETLINRTGWVLCRALQTSCLHVVAVYCQHGAVSKICGTSGDVACSFCVFVLFDLATKCECFPVLEGN